MCSRQRPVKSGETRTAPLRLTTRGRIVLALTSACALAAAAWTGWLWFGCHTESARAAIAQRTQAARTPRAEAPPGIGPRTASRIPAATTQLVVASGDGADQETSTARLYERSAPGEPWHQRGNELPAHNGHNGWSSDHTEGDGRSPIGVYTLTDAGGRLPAPADTRLPYERNPQFVATGNDANDNSVAGAFDYVIAIDYNRVTGVSPIDPRRPQGQAKGGGVWLHVDHHGGTQACISVSRPGMKWLLGTLDQQRRPAIAMGPADELAK